MNSVLVEAQKFYKALRQEHLHAIDRIDAILRQLEEDVADVAYGHVREGKKRGRKRKTAAIESTTARSGSFYPALVEAAIKASWAIKRPVTVREVERSVRKQSPELVKKSKNLNQSISIALATDAKSDNPTVRRVGRGTYEPIKTLGE